ncbi:MAG: 23S rRNA (guanosine(2251)-2'-O)-methyltransferase RlmB [Solirubrobacteraceae bacterium]
MLYGRNAVHEALRAGRRKVRGIWATAATLAGEDWLADRDVQAADGEWLSELAGTHDHQGVVLAVTPFRYAELEELLAAAAAAPADSEGDAPLLLALDEIQDPQNLGALARTAECVGATGLLICRHRAADVTAAAVKASAGAIEHLPVAQVRNLADALGDARDAGVWIYGAAGAANGAAGPVPYDRPDYRGPVVLVMGAEGSGLRPRVASVCDELVALPQRGRIDSLNVSSAAAVLLYEILQRRERLDKDT